MKCCCSIADVLTTSLSLTAIEPATSVTPTTTDVLSQETTSTIVGSSSDLVPTLPLDLTTIVAIAGGFFVILIIIVIILVVICLVRHRIKTLGREENSFDIRQQTPIDELDGSLSVKRKKTPSPKHSRGRESDCSYSSTELRSYGSEHRRAGSRTPPPSDIV